MTAEEIKTVTSMKKLLLQYGVNVIRERCKCFIHGGQHLSMSVYKDKVVHCFKCGASLDVFGVVQHFEQCSFIDALKRLGGEEKPSLEVKQKARQLLFKQNQLDVAKKRYDAAFRKWSACDYIRIYYTQTHDPAVYPYFVFAMQNISYYQKLLEESEVKLFELRTK